MTDGGAGLGGRGSVSGTVSNGSIHFSISVSAGGFDSPYESCTAEVSGAGQASTSSAAVELILSRLRESGEFPAMSKTVGAISQLTASSDTSTSALANAVLQDYCLAQKLLRLVNKLEPGRFGRDAVVHLRGSRKSTAR